MRRSSVFVDPEEYRWVESLVLSLTEDVLDILKQIDSEDVARIVLMIRGINDQVDGANIVGQVGCILYDAETATPKEFLTAVQNFAGGGSADGGGGPHGHEIHQSRAIEGMDKYHFLELITVKLAQHLAVVTHGRFLWERRCPIQEINIALAMFAPHLKVEHLVSSFVQNPSRLK